MEDIPNDIRILVHINDNGPQTFSELVDDKKLNFSRNTVNKYLKILRNKKWFNTKYENDKKLNYITTEGKIQLEKYLGKDDITHQFRAYTLFEKKIKICRDDFLNKIGNIPNSILMDCIENFIEFEQYNFDVKLPSKDFQYYLAYFLARYNLQYCKSEKWLLIQPDIILLLQNEFIKKFELDPIEIKYFSQEWGKIKQIWSFIDEKDELWFLSSTSLMYILLMEHILYRVRRGTLQELLFDNFIFNSADEAAWILREIRLGWQLNIDFSQVAQLQSFIQRNIEYFLERKKGYSRPWLNLPTDFESLMSLSINLEEELNGIKENTLRKSEILRILHYINAHLKNHKEALFWGNEYLKINPRDLGMLSIITYYYFIEKQYPEFLEMAEKIRKEFGYDMITRTYLIEYYLEINLNVDKAMEIIEEAEKIVLREQNLEMVYSYVLYAKAKVYFLLEEWDNALIDAEKAWFEQLGRKNKLFQLLADIYKKIEDWERLEDFCLQAYNENEYNDKIFPDLYFALLKRRSHNKADRLYIRVKRHYPDLIENFDNIKKQMK